MLALRNRRLGHSGYLAVSAVDQLDDPAAGVQASSARFQNGGDPRRVLNGREPAAVALRLSLARQDEVVDGAATTPAAAGPSAARESFGRAAITPAAVNIHLIAVRRGSRGSSEGSLESVPAPRASSAVC